MAAHQAPPSLGFSRQEQWSGLPFPSPDYLWKLELLLVFICFRLFTCLFYNPLATATAKSLQPCPTPCDPIDSLLPGSSIPGILQARTLEWVAISFFNVWRWKVKVKSFSCVRLLATSWTAAYQAPPSMGFSRQEYWSGVPLLFSKNNCLRYNSYIIQLWFTSTIKKKT